MKQKLINLIKSELENNFEGCQCSAAVDNKKNVNIPVEFDEVEGADDFYQYDLFSHNGAVVEHYVEDVLTKSTFRPYEEIKDETLLDILIFIKDCS